MHTSNVRKSVIWSRVSYRGVTSSLIALNFLEVRYCSNQINRTCSLRVA